MPHATGLPSADSTLSAHWSIGALRYQIVQGDGCFAAAAALGLNSGCVGLMVFVLSLLGFGRSAERLSFRPSVIRQCEPILHYSLIRALLVS